MSIISKFGFSILVILSFLTILYSCKQDIADENKNTAINIEEGKIDEPQKLLRHIVLFNFNESASEEIIDSIEQEFVDLQNTISAIHSFEWGTNNSPEGLDKGFTHCFLVSFLSVEDRSTYLPHPEHQKIVSFIGPYVEDVTVVDYWIE